MLSPDLQTATIIVEEVLGQKIEHLFRKMDDLEERFGHWSDMPLTHFQEHHRLSMQAATLAISRDRIVRRLRNSPSGPPDLPDDIPF